MDNIQRALGLRAINLNFLLLIHLHLSYLTMPSLTLTGLFLVFTAFCLAPCAFARPTSRTVSTLKNSKPSIMAVILNSVSSPSENRWWYILNNDKQAADERVRSVDEEVDDDDDDDDDEEEEYDNILTNEMKTKKRFKSPCPEGYVYTHVGCQKVRHSGRKLFSNSKADSYKMCPKNYVLIRRVCTLPFGGLFIGLKK
ncbi:hypothetical protein CHUAL_002093 [Chamberlinius hualienensis]